MQHYVDEGGCFTELHEDGTLSVGLSKLLTVTPHPGVNLRDLTEVRLNAGASIGAAVQPGDALVEFFFTAEAAQRAGVIPPAYYYGAYAPLCGKTVWLNPDLTLEKLRDDPAGMLGNDLHVARIELDTPAEYQEYILEAQDYLISGADMAAGKTMSDF